jgi:hypothetical protein
MAKSAKHFSKWPGNAAYNAPWRKLRDRNVGPNKRRAKHRDENDATAHHDPPPVISVLTGGLGFWFLIGAGQFRFPLPNLLQFLIDMLRKHVLRRALPV